MAMAAMGQAMLPQAITYLEQASRIAQQRRDGRSNSLIAWQSAVCYEELGRSDLAQAEAQRAIQLARQFELPTADRYAESLARFLRGGTPLSSGTDESGGDSSRGNWLLDEPVHMVLADTSRDKTPRPASVLQMAFTATRSMAKFAAAGFKSIHRDERDKRLDICRDCEHYTGIRCKICGCFVAAKTWLRHEACPVDKW
jgi:tetratricopeptide (TPR) repeat protein